MVDRNPSKTPQRYQPLPKGQTIIVLTDKTQLISEDYQNPAAGETTSPKGDGSGLKNTKNLKPGKTMQMVDKNGECKIMYSHCLLEAYLTIEAPLNAGKWPSVEEAMRLIEAENIVNIDQKAVMETIERHQTMPVLIARGEPATNGQDSEIYFFFELNDLHKIFIEGLVADSFGRVDYHRVKTVQTVVKGDVIAKKTMSTPGKNGVDVHGRIIPAVPGVDKPLKLGKNVEWDEDKIRIIATNGGKPTLNNNILSVLPIHEIRGDVDFHTGNIVFEGNVIVYGNVNSGFKIDAEGDVVIMGNVDAAEINAGGKLSVKGRVFGNDKGKLVCGGDFFAKEIDHVTLICYGTVTVYEAIMHSHVTSETRVLVESGKGWIVGGTIQAREEIVAKTIGSRLGTVTDLELGAFKSLINDGESIENHQDGYSPVVPAKTLSRTTANSPERTMEPDQPVRTRGRIRFRDVIHPGVRVCFPPYRFIIQDEISFGSLTCSEGYFHILPYR
jgi:uncharacterized protein (DUF342 family)